METPDGRVSSTTPAPRPGRTPCGAIAPYFWSRGISWIDEVFLSHADLDHFNGMPELLKRFPVGRVTVTPSFADKTTPGVEAVLATFDRRGVQRRIAVVGERFEAGDVTFEVLHPPMEGPGRPQDENPRSMVLLVRHRGHSILLTGDLETIGQAMVTERPIPPVDVMLAPHHGGKSANIYPVPAARNCRRGSWTGRSPSSSFPASGRGDRSSHGGLSRRRRDRLGYADFRSRDRPLSCHRRGGGGVPERRGAGGGAELGS